MAIYLDVTADPVVVIVMVLPDDLKL